MQEPVALFANEWEYRTTMSTTVTYFTGPRTSPVSIRQSAQANPFGELHKYHNEGRIDPFVLALVEFDFIRFGTCEARRGIQSGMHVGWCNTGPNQIDRAENL